MKKRILSLMAAVCLLLSLLPAAMAEETPVFNAYDETVSVTIMGRDEKDSATVYDSSKPDRASANENAWIDAYKKYLNIDVTRIIAEDNQALNANLNTMMASGELPDVMIVPKEMFYVLAENGVLKDMSDVFNSYDGERWMSIKNSYADEVWQTGMYDGQLLGIPYAENFYNSTSVMWIRTDWLAKVGKEIPKTIDELEAVAQAFVDAKLGGDNTIGIGLAPLGNWNSDISSIMAAYGVQLTTWVEKDGKYVYSNTLDENKEGLLRLQGMYKKGLIKPDFSVSDIMGEEIANGNCGLYFAPAWNGVTSIKASLENDPEAAWTPVRIPSLDGNPVAQTTNAAVTRFVVVNADYEHPDVFFRMKELEAAVYYASAPGTDLYDLYMLYLEDGTTLDYTMWNLMVFRGMQRGDLDLYKSKLVVEAMEKNSPDADVLPIAQSTYIRTKAGLSTDRSLLGLATTFTKGYPTVNEIVAQGLVRGAYNGPLTENMSLYQTTINDELNSAMTKVIMGEDISVFEKAVEAWYASGGQAITDDVNAYYGK